VQRDRIIGPGQDAFVLAGGAVRRPRVTDAESITVITGSPSYQAAAARDRRGKGIAVVPATRRLEDRRVLPLRRDRHRAHREIASGTRYSQTLQQGLST
jgi:hypothetical protein